ADLISILGDRNQMHLEDLGHSPFAFALIEALRGKAELSSVAKKQDGIITPQELIIYLKRQVHHLTSLILDQAPEYFPIGGHEGGDFVFLDPNNPSNFSEWKARNPYKGLQSFEPEDRLFFFGREQAVEKILDKLNHLRESHQKALLFITAPSGQGKSSLVKAGVFPSLQQINAEEGKETLLFYCRPGIENQWSEYQVEADEEGQHYQDIKLVERLAQVSDQQRVVLLLDQFEEVLIHFTKEAIQAFCDELLTWLDSSQLTFIITVRSDSEWRLKQCQLLSFWKIDHIYRLPPMSLHQLRESIKQPAGLNWFEFESHLVDTILADVEGTPGALPLLSVMMQSLYQIEQSNANRQLRLQTYQNELQGIHGALSTKADSVLATLKAAPKGLDLERTLQKVFIRMVNLNDGGFARRRVYYQENAFTNEVTNRPEGLPSVLHELDYPDDQQDELIREVIEHLEANFLIVKNADSTKRPYIEPVHDALIQHWETGKQWIDEFGKECILLQRTLWNVVHSYQSKLAKGEKKGAELLLWDDHTSIDQLKRDLDEKGHWFNQSESEFVKRSWEKKQNIIVNLRRDANRSLAMAMAIEARRIASTDPTVGLNLALEAYHKFPGTESIAALNDIASKEEYFFYQTYPVRKSNTCIALSEELPFLACGSGKGLEIWDLEQGKLFRKFIRNDRAATAIAVSPGWSSGKRKLVALARFKDKATLDLYDIEEEEPLFSTTDGHQGKITKIVFMENQDCMISGAADGSIVIWNFDGTTQGHHTVNPDDLDTTKLKAQNPTDIIAISQRAQFDVPSQFAVLNRDQFYAKGDLKTAELSSPVALNNNLNGTGEARRFASAIFAFLDDKAHHLISSSYDGLDFWDYAGDDHPPTISRHISINDIIPNFRATITNPFQMRHGDPNFSLDRMKTAMAFMKMHEDEYILLSFDKHLFIVYFDGALAHRFAFEERIFDICFYSPLSLLIVLTMSIKKNSKVHVFSLARGTMRP
ncbi:MAG: AAA family ATPase, partial [Bacteroidota bacterium]